MRTVSVPQFDEFKNYKYTGEKLVKIKNKPDFDDYKKITKELPGFCQGYASGVYKLGSGISEIEVTSFYDGRQRSKRFKNYYVRLIN